MTDRTAHRMLGKILICQRLECAVKIICHLVFEIVTKHRFVVVLDSFLTVQGYCSDFFTAFCLLPSDLRFHYTHTTQNLRKFNASAIDPRFDSSFRYLQQINYFLIAQFLYVTQDDTGS